MLTQIVYRPAVLIITRIVILIADELCSVKLGVASSLCSCAESLTACKMFIYYRCKGRFSFLKWNAAQGWVARDINYAKVTFSFAHCFVNLLVLA